MNTKESAAIQWLYNNVVGSLIERQQHERNFPVQELTDERLLSLHEALQENETLSSFLLENGIDGIKRLIEKLANDTFLSQQNLKIYFATMPVEKEQLIERVLIQYIPIGNLGDEDKRKQRELLNVREHFIPEWEETLYRLLLRCIENKSEDFKRAYDEVRFKTALHGLSKNELTSHHFAGNDEKVLKALFANIAQDDGFVSVDGKLQYNGVDIGVNELLSKVIVHHIPQNFTAVNYSVQGATSSTSLLNEIGGGFAEVGAVVVDFFRTFWNNEEQANGRQN